MNNLSALLKPKSIAVVGASIKPSSAGNIVMTNLLQGGFEGVVMPVTPKHRSVCGVLAYPDVSSLPITPDVAILCTNASRNEALLQQLVARQVKHVIVLSATRLTKENNTLLCDITKGSATRLLGPNSLGIIMPWEKINASCSPINAKQGKIAFVSQSAAMCTTILDWANDKNIGFSAIISLGNALDIDFADLLDYLSMDSKTEAILLYVDTIKNARRFMSAARAASRNRRILVLKGGKTQAGRTAAYAHTGGLDSLDIIYDSAIQRSGMLRVNNSHELFAAVETLTHSIPLRGERLAIISNGGGPAIIAVDTLLMKGGQLASLPPSLIDTLSEILPDNWSHNNPIDLIGDAGQERYIEAIKAVMDSDCADAILIMHSPSASTDNQQTAQAIVEAINKHPRRQHFNILTNWSGEHTVKPARQIFTNAGIPTYRTPESAVIGFMHLVEYRRNQKQLMETPTNAEPMHVSELSDAKQWIANKLQDNVSLELDTHQIGAFLKFFNFNVLPTWLASDASEAVHISEQIGYPVAVKLRSPDIAHKSDIQGVMLNLRNHHEVASAAEAILDRAEVHYPSANIHGLLIQAMAKLAGGEEIRIKVKTDHTFGPVILLGQGGAEWDESIDATCALPPLNMALARYLVTRAIKEGKIRPQRLPIPMDITKLSELLVRISQMIVDCPQVYELDIHPLLAAGDKFTVIDADMILKQSQGEAQKRLAIRPYPVEYEERVQLKDGSSIIMRPILPEDEPNHAQFVSKVSKEDLYNRFFSDVGELNHEALANLTQIDYDREMAFIAITNSGSNPEIIGVSRALLSPDNTDAEFAILVRSDLKGMGLGKLLLQKIIDYCRQKNTKQISGMTMPTNRGMLMLAQKLGFELDVQFEDGTADMVLKLSE
ncbi:bifunctional acetate--CoA ligase family protein/GNAT family N-acetyltransferase [Vibrio sp. Of14-4]|uniref:bifunctional acetate--CoA ligase family protein/GNAT family N-acetyltransferase n=1 Tax=Vibrio sp. Of14-4 TaxID=2724878 RepID=UPI001EF1DF87|nr:bifunctional acetate--CoA ligase family protein/GNAT family N-acetyltransferase [Vibrio sp. Of14-4]MCG7491717.1 bifunctional acetate--CoA ligase family protein/GNAT family N-acetyltransferase [Vibrio sp. Of14-4]